MLALQTATHSFYVCESCLRLGPHQKYSILQLFYKYRYCVLQNSSESTSLVSAIYWRIQREAQRVC